MATPSVIDLEKLLEPVSDDQPAGPELRFVEGEGQSIYYAVRDARKKAGDAERRNRNFDLLTDEEKQLEPAAPDPPDWGSVQDFAFGALEKSKDLWILAWYIESLTRSDGFAGIRDGYLLARGFCNQFWDQVHPQPDESENLSATFAQLAGLNGLDSEGTLIVPIMNIPVTDETSAGQFSCSDYLDAAELELKDPVIRNQRIEQGAVTSDMFDRAVNETSVDFFQNLVEDLQQAIDAFQGFNAYVLEKLADAEGGTAMAPPSSSIEESLVECLRLVKVIARDMLGIDEDENTAIVVLDSNDGNSLTSSRVQTREDAFRLLLQVSDFFRRTEPHSPVSYAVEQAVRWGRMNLPELLAELISDDNSRREIFKRTGINEESQND